jgi:hypothetical protein
MWSPTSVLSNESIFSVTRFVVWEKLGAFMLVNTGTARST